MRFVPVLLAVFVTLPALAFEGGMGGVSYDGFDDYVARQDSSHVGYCMDRISAEARARQTKVTSLTGQLVPSKGAMVLGAIGDFENGTHCECAWNEAALNCN